MDKPDDPGLTGVGVGVEGVLGDTRHPDRVLQCAALDFDVSTAWAGAEEGWEGVPPVLRAVAAALLQPLDVTDPHSGELAVAYTQLRAALVDDPPNCAMGSTGAILRVCNCVCVCVPRFIRLPPCLCVCVCVRARCSRIASRGRTRGLCAVGTTTAWMKCLNSGTTAKRWSVTCR